MKTPCTSPPPPQGCSVVVAVTALFALRLAGCIHVARGIEGNVSASPFAPGIPAHYLDEIDAALADAELPSCAPIAAKVARLSD